MNIFYTEVDENLQKELNARGRSGFYDRSEKALNFMLGKIANVEINAYAENDSNSDVVGSIGGNQVRSGRFMPTDTGGYLTDAKVTTQEVAFWSERDANNSDDPNIIAGNAYIKNTDWTDTSRRTGPYITAVDINIGDHSMGLLNKATVQFTIPNPQRDLDLVEQIWFRPGRYMSIDIEHPESALVSAGAGNINSQNLLSGNLTNGLLTEKTIPNREKLEELYPSWKTEMDKFIRQMSRLNAVRFEGLITQFDFQFAQDGSITATLNITGTSNVYTDISMYVDSNKTKDKQPPKAKAPEDLTAVITGSRKEFYNILYDQFKELELSVIANNSFESTGRINATMGVIKTKGQYIIPYVNREGKNPGNTDRYILFGEPYSPTVATTQGTNVGVESQSNYSRYITFGALVHFINNYIVTKVSGSVGQPEIVFTDTACFSNYYDSLVSCIPDDILLLPEISPAVNNFNFVQAEPPSDCNTYGELVYYAEVNKNITTTGPGPQNTNTTWPGVYSKQGNAGKYYPSRIFINLETIQEIIDALSKKNTANFTVTSFISSICDKILYATGGAFNLKLVSHPEFRNKLMLMDTKFIDQGKINSTKQTVPYSVPMFSNHRNGSIVRDFGFSAKLPENAKNLSYVLNSGDDVSELDIAPYMNFMYNAQNVDQINQLYKRHRDAYDKHLDELKASRAQLGESPTVPELQTALRKALAEYIKKPSPSFTQTTQMAAPIFPFEASITIDGINGFKYGDVLQFEALPSRYRMNTVFSVINITHTVSNTGDWTTQLRCIMRPSID